MKNNILSFFGAFCLAMCLFATAAQAQTMQTNASSKTAPKAVITDTLIIKFPSGKNLTVISGGASLAEIASQYNLGAFLDNLDTTLISSFEKSSGASEEIKMNLDNYKRNNQERKIDTTFNYNLKVHPGEFAKEVGTKTAINLFIGKTDNKGNSKSIIVISDNNQLASLLDSLQQKSQINFQVSTLADGTRILIIENNGFSNTSIRKNNFTSKEFIRQNNNLVLPKFRRFYDFNLELGLNNYFQDNGNLPSDNANHSLSPIGSRFVALRGNCNYSWKMGKSETRRFVVIPGLEVQWFNFMFKNNVVLQKEGGNNVFVPASNLNYKSIEKSKLSAAYLNVPLMFKIQNLTSDISLAFGVYGGYLLDAYTKVRYTQQDGDKTKQRFRAGSYNVNNLQYGLKAEIGFSDVNIFFRYNLNKLFKDDPNSPQLTPIAIGISL